MTDTIKTVQAVAMTALMVLSVVAISAPAAAAPAVSVSAPSNAGQVQPGNSFTVQYSYENTGSDPGAAGRIEFNTPTGVEATSISGDGTSGLGGSPQSVLYGFGGPIGAGDTLTTTVTFEVDSSVSTGTYDIDAEGYIQDNSGNEFSSGTQTTSFDVATSSTTPTPTPPQSGSQAGAPELNKGTHYVDTQEGPILELAFNEDVTATNPQVTITLNNDTDISVPSSWIQAPNGGRVVVDTQGTVYSRVEEVTVSGYEDSDGNNLGQVEEDVKFAPSTVNTNTNANVDAYQGSNVTLEGNVGDTFEINTNTDDDLNYDVNRGTGANSQVYVFDTDSRDTGEYRIENDRTGTNSSLTLQDLDLQVDVDESSFDDDENVTATVSSNDINRDVDVDLLDSGGDEEEELTVTLDSDGEAEVDFGEVDTGNYTIEATDVSTQVSTESDPFDVVEADDAEATFADDGVFVEEAGDVANVTINLQNTDSAVLSLGDESDDNYNIVMNLTDDSDDGQVTVQFNSYSAGAVSDADANPAVVTVADDDDDVEVLSQSGPFQDRNRTVGTNLLDPTDYDMNVTGENGATDVTSDNEDDVGTISLQERSTENLQTWVAPEDSFSDIEDIDNDDAGDVYQLAEDGLLTQSDTLATQDTLVVQIDASGLEGLFKYHDEVNGFSEARALQEHTGNFQADSLGHISAVFEDENPGPNVDDEDISVDELNTGDLHLIVDEENDSHFLAVDSQGLVDEGVEDDDEYTANFSVADEDVSELGTDDEEAQNVSMTFNVQDRSDETSLNNDDDVVVRAATNQTISGETAAAPGTELTVRIRSEDSSAPFLKQPEAVVQEDGTFNATADFDEEQPGANFTAQVRLSGQNLGDEIDGRVAAAPVASVSISDQESDGETVTVDSVSLSDGGFVVIHDSTLLDGEVASSVIGNSDYLESGSHEDVEISVEAQDGDFTAIAMPHLDTNGNEEYDFPGADGPYTENGSAVVASANVTVATSTPTPTPTPTDEPTATPTPTATDEPSEPTATPTTTSQDGPGFTAVIALVALVAAALLAVRRND